MIFSAGMTPATSPLTPSEPLSRTTSESPKRRRRRRWTAGQKADLLARYSASGLRAAEFCRREGLRSATISGWIRRQRASERSSAKSGFAEVRVQSAVPSVNGAAMLLVQFGSDINLSVPPGTDALWLGQLIRAARSS